LVISIDRKGRLVTARADYAHDVSTSSSATQKQADTKLHLYSLSREARCTCRVGGTSRTLVSLTPTSVNLTPHDLTPPGIREAVDPF
jgi:hypothetical protein